MIGILLLTHMPLGQAFVAAVSHVFQSTPPNLQAIDMIPDENRAEVEERAKKVITQIDDGSGVLVMTDIMGGSPSNCCNHLGVPDHVNVIAGISLPMLLRAISYRNETLDVVTEMALAGGQSGAIQLDARIRVGQE